MYVAGARGQEIKGSGTGNLCLTRGNEQVFGPGPIAIGGLRYRIALGAGRISGLRLSRRDT